MWAWKDLGGVFEILENGVVVGRVYNKGLAIGMVKDFNNYPSQVTGTYRVRAWMFGRVSARVLRPRATVRSGDAAGFTTSPDWIRGGRKGLHVWLGVRCRGASGRGPPGFTADRLSHRRSGDPFCAFRAAVPPARSPRNIPPALV